MEFKKLIPDMLHLFLRITDKLEKLFVSKLNKFYSSLNENIEDFEQLYRYQELLKNLGISNGLYFSEKEFKNRSLNGKDKKKLFYAIYLEEIKLQDHFPNIEKIERINEVYKLIERFNFFKIKFFLIIRYGMILSIYI